MYIIYNINIIESVLGLKCFGWFEDKRYNFCFWGLG